MAIIAIVVDSLGGPALSGLLEIYGKKFKIVAWNKAIFKQIDIIKKYTLTCYMNSDIVEIYNM